MRYTVNTLSQAVAFGDSLKVFIQTSALSEKIDPQISHYELWIEEKAVTQCYGVDTITRTKFAETMVPFQWATHRIASTTNLPYWECEAAVSLPTSLRVCRQSVRTEYITIKHWVWVKIVLKRPEGRSDDEPPPSIARRIPIKIFISEHLPLLANDTTGASVVPRTNPASSPGSTTESMQDGPPRYSGHFGDLRVGERQATDPAFRSPTTGNATPTFIASRRTSSEALYVEGSDSPEGLPWELVERLRDIGHQSSPHTPGSWRTRHNTGTASSATTNGQSENTSTTPNDSLYNMDDLQKVQSYATAVRTPARMPSGGYPPTYDESTSTVPSPNRSRSPAENNR